MQEMFLDENAHHLSSSSIIKMSYLKTNPQPNSLQAKSKKLMQKAKKNMRKINFKKAVAQKFREYDKKLEALTNFNVSEAFENRYSYPKTLQIEWFPKKSGLAKRRTTWFDLFLKSDIDKNENHILGPITITIAKKFTELIQKDELIIADLKGAGLKWLKVQYNNDVELEYYVSQLKAAVLS
ncbi:hypothetical protein Tco_0066453 [Tanacetum coccineum]